MLELSSWSLVTRDYLLRICIFSWSNLNQPIAKIFHFCVVCPIWKNFGVGSNNGPINNIEWVWNAFYHFLIYQPDQSKPTSSESFNFCVFIWFGWNWVQGRPPQQIILFYKISHVRRDSGWKLSTECGISIQNAPRSIFMTGIGGQSFAKVIGRSNFQNQSSYILIADLDLSQKSMMNEWILFR